MRTGIELIIIERQRQIQSEGWDESHDDMHTAMQLSAAAACYIANAHNKEFKDHTHNEKGLDCARFQIRNVSDVPAGNWEKGWPFDEEWDKREKHDAKRSLVIAGALIAAELDRMQATETE